MKEAEVSKDLICPKCGTQMEIEAVPIQDRRGIGKTFFHFLMGTWLIALFRGRKTNLVKIGKCPNCGNIVDIEKRKKKIRAWMMVLFIFVILPLALFLISMILNFFK